MSKSVIYIFIAIGGLIGGYLGGLLDGGGSVFGFWGIAGSTLGGLAGVYIGYKIQQ
jgi:hypothetical protein